MGRPLSRTYGNGARVANSHHPRSQRLATVSGPGIELGYGYDPVGNITSLSDGGQVTTFGYDAFDRLVTASGGYSASYSYAANGNLLTKGEAGAAVTLVYPAASQPRPHAPTAVSGQAYTYDANGNLTARPGQSFTYDAANRLVHVVSEAITATFSYDGDDQLVQAAVVAGLVRYLNPQVEARPRAACPPVPPALPARAWLPLVDLHAGSWRGMCTVDKGTVS